METQGRGRAVRTRNGCRACGRHGTRAMQPRARRCRETRGGGCSSEPEVAPEPRGRRCRETQGGGCSSEPGAAPEPRGRGRPMEPGAAMEHPGAAMAPVEPAATVAAARDSGPGQDHYETERGGHHKDDGR